jgi:hypothetical protein
MSRVVVVFLAACTIAVATSGIALAQASSSSSSSSRSPAVDCFYLRMFLDNPKDSVGANNERIAQACSWIFPEQPQSFCDSLANDPDKKKIVGYLIATAQNRALSQHCQL